MEDSLHHCQIRPKVYRALLHQTIITYGEMRKATTHLNMSPQCSRMPYYTKAGHLPLINLQM